MKSLVLSSISITVFVLFVICLFLMNGLGVLGLIFQFLFFGLTLLPCIAYLFLEITSFSLKNDLIFRGIKTLFSLFGILLYVVAISFFLIFPCILDFIEGPKTIRVKYDTQTAKHMQVIRLDNQEKIRLPVTMMVEKYFTLKNVTHALEEATIPKALDEQWYHPTKNRKNIYFSLSYYPHSKIRINIHNIVIQ